MATPTLSRRKFTQAAATALAGSLLGGNRLWGMPAILGGKPNSKIQGVQLGVITYSYRSMPDQSAEATLQYILDSGVSAIELMGEPAEAFAGAPQSAVDFRTVWPLYRKRRSGEALTEDEMKTLAEAEVEREAHRQALADWRATVSMDRFEALRKLYKKAGVTIYGFKPSAFGGRNTEAEMRYGMRAALALGATHVTLEHPDDDAHTLKLGQLAQETGVQVAYHGHEQQTPTFWDTALAQSPANALNLDLGHYIAAGNPSPLDLIRQHHGRIASMHVKDRQTPDHGKANLPWGTGDTPIAEVLRLMRDEKYRFPATIELEYEVPDGSDAVQEVKKCLAFCREALEG